MHTNISKDAYERSSSFFDELNCMLYLNTVSICVSCPGVCGILEKEFLRISGILSYSVENFLFRNSGNPSRIGRNFEEIAWVRVNFSNTYDWKCRQLQHIFIFCTLIQVFCINKLAQIQFKHLSIEFKQCEKINGSFV